MKTAGLFTAFIFMILGGCGKATTDADIIEAATGNYIADFTAAAEKLVLESDTPGVAVAIVKKDGRRWARGFGYADLEKQSAMTEHTVISIGSVSKTITATAVVKAVEDGLLELDADINGYLPFIVENPSFPGRPITMRHLLTHTATTSDNRSVYKSDAVYYWGGDSPISLGEFSENYFSPGGEYYSAGKNYSKAAPGTSYEYSNVGFALAGLLVERVSGQSFSEYSTENIFKPLGMENTGWLYSDVDSSLFGKQYGLKSKNSNEKMSGRAVGQWRAYRPYGLTTYPDGGLKTSVSDLSKFLIAIMNGGVLDGERILDAQSVSMMLAPQKLGYDRIPNLRPVQDQALGFVYEIPASVDASTVFIGHNGGDPGTNTFMYFDPESEVGIIYFTNADVYSAAHIHAIQTIIRSMIVNAERFFE